MSTPYWKKRKKLEKRFPNSYEYKSSSPKNAKKPQPNKRREKSNMTEKKKPTKTNFGDYTSGFNALKRDEKKNPWSF